MREMGTVELLTREGEIAIAKRIEEGIREMMAALACYPNAVNTILLEYASTETEEKKLSDVLIGYLDPADSVPSAQEIADAQAAKTAKAENGEEEEEVIDTGPDPEEAKERFDVIAALSVKADRSINRYGREAASSVKNLFELGEKFKYLKLTPRVLDPVINNPRELHQVRTQEREIMRLCVQKAKMPRKDFIKAFVGHETDMSWIDAIIKADDNHMRLNLPMYRKKFYAHIKKYATKRKSS